MARRVAITAEGLRISEPGWDALTAPEANLRFSPSGQQLQQVGAGQFYLTSGITIPFPQALPVAPIVVCGLIGRGGVGYPVLVSVGGANFQAFAGSVPGGGTPAEGQLCRWVAFMRNKS